MGAEIWEKIVGYIKGYLTPKSDVDIKNILTFLVNIYNSFIEFSEIVFGFLHRPSDEVLFPIIELIPGVVPSSLIEFLESYSISDVLFGSAVGVIIFGIFWKWVREFLPW